MFTSKFLTVDLFLGCTSPLYRHTHIHTSHLLCLTEQTNYTCRREINKETKNLSHGANSIASEWTKEEQKLPLAIFCSSGHRFLRCTTVRNLWWTVICFIVFRSTSLRRSDFFFKNWWITEEQTWDFSFNASRKCALYNCDWD